MTFAKTHFQKGKDMASKATIITQIERTTEGQYADWQIGITDDPMNRRAQLGHPLSWVHWQTNSRKQAEAIRQYFLSKGMSYAGKIKETGNYVYILLQTAPSL